MQIIRAQSNDPSKDVGYIVCITILRFREDPMPFWRFPMRDVG